MHFWFCFYVIRSGICFYHQFQSSDYLPKCCILEKEVRSHRTPNGWFVLMFYVSFSLWFLLLFYYFYSNMQNDWMNIVIDRKALELAAQSCPWIKWLSEAKVFFTEVWFFLVVSQFLLSVWCLQVVVHTTIFWVVLLLPVRLLNLFLYIFSFLSPSCSAIIAVALCLASLWNGYFKSLMPFYQKLKCVRM